MKTFANAALLFASFGLVAAPSHASETPEPNRIVYWGNTTTGNAVRVVNATDAEKKAEAKVKAIGGSGWVLLENSTKPGFGAALCKREGATINFYVAHGYASGKEAVSAAKAKASGGGFFCNNALWRVTEQPPTKESGVIDAAKGAVFNAVTKEKREGEKETLCKEPKQNSVALPPAGSVNPKQERRECPTFESNEGGSNLSCTCVRG